MVYTRITKLFNHLLKAAYRVFFVQLSIKTDFAKAKILLLQYLLLLCFVKEVIDTFSFHIKCQTLHLKNNKWEHCNIF